MKCFHTAVLLVSIFLWNTAGAEPIRWNHVPTAPTVNIYQQQPVPDYAANVSNGFATLANVIKEYEATRPSSNSAPAPVEPNVAGRVTYLTDQNGRQVKCVKYGDSVFCP